MLNRQHLIKRYSDKSRYLYTVTPSRKAAGDGEAELPTRLYLTNSAYLALCLTRSLAVSAHSNIPPDPIMNETA
ncbi:hypothetical protein BOTCAL_0248g00030 [Botryotinia calthae]|uniref:Uncharacterized protein n=1 Tax=Botryotinia calthae TaxID=38488 RepID=A0A4Y8CZH2_9HELO|nr:hypothetical protein BOTCAL_0248g00030 [Botryotinia calthae]